MTHVPKPAASAAIAVLLTLVVMTTKTDAELSPEEEKCGLWLGPSSIKENEEHGWGHSIFTGKFIEKGTFVVGSGVLKDGKVDKIKGDLFIPIYDWEGIDMASFANWNDDLFPADDDHLENRKNAELKKKALKDDLEAEKEQEPPLFHELWDGEIYPDVVLESEDSMRSFVPGLSTMCPCTYMGFNLEQVKSVTYRDWRDRKVMGHDESPPSPQAGSFSYLSNAMFIAARDIMAGEELVVECADNGDDFDPSAYPPSKFTPKEAGGYSICLDDKVEGRLADHTANVLAKYGGQRGLFAKRNLKKDEILTSTPMIPVHKEEMIMDREKYEAMLQDADTQKIIEKIGLPPQKKQLLTNYMYAHHESSLMWLATTPLLHYVNHALHDNAVKPNAKIQWHHDKYTDAQAAGKPLSRRQEFHHAELLQLDSLEVVIKHGMGLMVDLVALRDIDKDEEILIDYGKEWDDAWKKHINVWKTTIDAITEGHKKDNAEWKQQRKREREARDRQDKLTSEHHEKKHRQKHVENSLTAMPLSSYITASDYNQLHLNDDIRTVAEQRRKPYPSNIETACYFETDWLDDEINKDEEAEEITYKSWYEQEDQLSYCLLPCIVMERREYVPGEEASIHDILDDDFNERPQFDGKENGGSVTNKRYMAKLLDNHESNTSIGYECHIFKRFEYYYMDIPREGITFVNKMHSTDQWIDQAFRQPIGLPEEMVPKNWRDLSRRKGTRGGNKKKSEPVQKMTTEQTLEEKEYQHSIKKWNEVESRREKLNEIKEKVSPRNSPRYDL